MCRIFSPVHVVDGVLRLTLRADPQPARNGRGQGGPASRPSRLPLAIGKHSFRWQQFWRCQALVPGIVQCVPDGSRVMMLSVCAWHLPTIIILRCGVPCELRDSMLRS